MKTSCLITSFWLTCLTILIFRPASAFAQQNLTKKGIHLLHPEEIELAAQFLGQNQSAGGYVTIPLRLDDLDVKKWSRFFQTCEQHQIVPLIRLATVQANGGWRQPTRKDIVSLANFLNLMPWPQVTRHIIIFNEPNHALEWGGKIDPAHYATTLEFAARWFQTEKHSQYFILPAGFDAAAPNSATTMDSFTFINQMAQASPAIFDLIDGWTSHSYPNPDFSSPPTYHGKNSISGFKYELTYLKKFTLRHLPVFITETGWSQTTSNQKRIARYYQLAFDQIWNDQQITAVTPFLLKADAGPFRSFSLLNPDGSPTPAYQTLQKI